MDQFSDEDIATAQKSLRIMTERGPGGVQHAMLPINPPVIQVISRV